MESFLDLTKLNSPELIVMLIAGALLLFFGYRIKKVAFFIIWFLIGFNLMRILMPIIEPISPEVLKTELWQILLPVAGGLLLAMLGFTIEKICVAGIVFGATLMITSQYFGTEIQILVIGAIIGVVLGGIATMLMKPAIIVISSLMGAYVITLAVLFWSKIDPSAYYFPLLIGITIIGTIAQLLTTKHID